MIGKTVKWRKWHKSHAGREQVTYTGVVEKEFSNGVLFVRITAVEISGQDIPGWNYTQVNKARIIE